VWYGEILPHILPGIAPVMAPLFILKKQFKAAFDTVNMLLLSNILLAHCDSNKTLVLTCDCSSYELTKTLKMESLGQYAMLHTCLALLKRVIHKSRKMA